MSVVSVVSVVTAAAGKAGMAGTAGTAAAEEVTAPDCPFGKTSDVWSILESVWASRPEAK